MTRPSDLPGYPNERRERGSFWTTLPGRVIAITGLLVGGILLVLLLYLAHGGSNTTTNTTSFVIRDRLGQDQIAENVIVTIDGKRADLTVDQTSPTDQYELSVSGGPGRYDYTTEVAAVFRDQYGGERQVFGASEGMIEVHEGKLFEVVGNFNGDTWQVSLEEG